jgi:hypothetical protein
MAGETAKFYGLFFKSLGNKEVDLDSDTLKVMLCTSAYTPNQDTHQYKSSVTGEVTGTGYTAGGATLTSVVAAYDAATNVYSLDAADAAWAGSTITARYGVVYDSTPATDATRPLIGYIDFGADVSSVGAAFTIQWNASGMFAITVA